ncbi:hypothetical protein PFICI_15104 [Pestalotiopsis fici W106-1]|uniref:Uncharacterized protein n=1 Tax=Pestalotiopsis fici (strain W106-1 / CGMCC3.15140) TaxID=1229662 RepID=W3WH89_PESFW|nr:uncharacterized protein PFICI_15104 [Pestalotiopsis fici W106-1]ETS73159.1 hypothetical protein PFICI_15104 [Pestalotiopsis fici W106-1]
MSATAPRLVRIAVLESLQFPENIGRERGTFTTVFGNWLERSVTEYNTKRRVSEQVVIRATGFIVVDGKYPEHVGHDFDAIIVTGSMQSAYDKTP